MTRILVSMNPSDLCLKNLADVNIFIVKQILRNWVEISMMYSILYVFKFEIQVILKARMVLRSLL